MRNLFDIVRMWYRQKVYTPGRVLSEFVARDVRRDIRIISVESLDHGKIVGQVRTNNVLYLSKGLKTAQDFGEPVSLDIATMWEWSGKPWGGLPDGSSIADQIQNADNTPKTKVIFTEVFGGKIAVTTTESGGWDPEKLKSMYMWAANGWIDDARFDVYDKDDFELVVAMLETGGGCETLDYVPEPARKKKTYVDGVIVCVQGEDWREKYCFVKLHAQPTSAGDVATRAGPEK